MEVEAEVGVTRPRAKSTKGRWEPREAKTQQGGIWPSELWMEGTWPADILVLNFRPPEL